MPNGIPVSRQWISVLPDGKIVLDWGNGRGVDLTDGETVRFSPDAYTTPVSDEDLDLLKRMGRVLSYDHSTIYVPSLPERAVD